MHRHRFALHVEQSCPHLAQRLISALELWNRPRTRSLYSPDLLAATVQSAADEVARVDSSRIVDGARLRHSALFAMGSLAAVTLSSALAGDLLASALHRCAHPLTAFDRPAKTQIDLAVDRFEVVRGEDVHVVVRFSGELPASARVLRRESSQLSGGGKKSSSTALIRFATRCLQFNVLFKSKWLLGTVCPRWLTCRLLTHLP